MLRRLIILLLIVGCGTEPEDDIKEVAWIYKNTNNSSTNHEGQFYWTEGYAPIMRQNNLMQLSMENDSFYVYGKLDSDGLCCNASSNPTKISAGADFKHLYFFQTDSLYVFMVDSVENITHNIDSDRFELNYGNEVIEIGTPYNYQIFIYQYK